MNGHVDKENDSKNNNLNFVRVLVQTKIIS